MNIIFDIADVLLDWDIDIMLKHIEAPDDRQQVMSGIIEHDDWLKLDRGNIDLKTAIDRSTKRTGLSSEVITEVMNAIPHSLVPNNDTIAILDDIDREQHRLFCLSNLHQDTWEGVHELYDFWDIFEGIVISWQTGYIKPEHEIYEFFLKKFDLQPEDCLFIDDRPGNIAGASEVGIQAILYKNPTDCRAELKRYLTTNV